MRTRTLQKGCPRLIKLVKQTAGSKDSKSTLSHNTYSNGGERSRKIAYLSKTAKKMSSNIGTYTNQSTSTAYKTSALNQQSPIG